jgi:hypothetical protein
MSPPAFMVFVTAGRALPTGNIALKATIHHAPMRVNLSLYELLPIVPNCYKLYVMAVYQRTYRDKHTSALVTCETFTYDFIFHG